LDLPHLDIIFFVFGASRPAVETGETFKGRCSESGPPLDVFDFNKDLFDFNDVTHRVRRSTL